MRKTQFLIWASIPALAVSQPAFAQASDSDAASGDIIVTAQRRAERLQDVPITITSLDSQKLERANVQQLSDIVKLTPATRFDYQAAFVQPSIRGIGNAVVTVGGSSNVGIYMDGFYSPTPVAGDLQLLNVTGIQVLKGPQGTLFGRNTTGGAVLVTTVKPSTETSGKAELSYGRFNTFGAKAYITTGLTQNIAFDLEGSYRRSDGWVHNKIAAGPEHPGRAESWSIRAGLNVELSDKASFLLRYTHQDVNDATQLASTAAVIDGFNYQIRQPNLAPYPASQVATGYLEVAIPTAQESFFRFKGDVFQLTGNFDLGFANLTSYTQYRKEDTLIGEEQDSIAVPISYNTIPVHARTFTQELLMTSKPGGRLQWTAGLFYFRNTENYKYVGFGVDLPTAVGAIGPSSRTQTFAAYLDLTYQLADKLFLTAGARYSHDIFDRAGIFVPGDVQILSYPAAKGDTVTPRAVLRYAINDQTSVYASYTRGYKSAIVDVVSKFLNPAATGAIKPEKMDSFEIGVKHASGPFSFNVSAWYYKYRDLQVSFYPFGLSLIKNAERARVKGIEADMRVEPVPGLTLTASGAYVDAKYSQFTDGSPFFVCNGNGVAVPSDLAGRTTTDPFACSAATAGQWVAVTGTDLSGKQMQRAPKFSATLGANYEFKLGGGKANLGISLYHTDSFYFDAAQQFRQPAYDLVGLRAEWTDPSDHYTLAVYGDNIAGAKYYTQVIPHAPAPSAIWGAPETWGVSVKAKF